MSISGSLSSCAAECRRQRSCRGSWPISSLLCKTAPTPHFEILKLIQELKKRDSSGQNAELLQLDLQDFLLFDWLDSSMTEASYKALDAI